MDKLRCIVADDEPLALDLLTSLVSAIPGVSIVSVCRDGAEALEAIRSEQPDLAFLDIEMPELSGLEIIRRLQPEAMPAIVFTTAFNQYAVDAFEIHAVDYVLKPLSAERLATAVERAKLRLAGERELHSNEKASIMSAFDQIFERDSDQQFHYVESRQPDPNPHKLLIRDAGKIHVVDQENIDWVDAAGDYMCVHIGKETLVMRTTMKKLVEELDVQLFARIHRSTLVNVSRVRKIETLGKGDCILHLREGVSLKASRNYRDHLMGLLN